MNLYEIFDAEERKLVGKIKTLENRDYSKEEINKIENEILEDIMSNSKKDISKVQSEYSGILNKLESL